MFGLRMREGVEMDAFLGDIARIGQLETDGLARAEGGRVRLTPRGQLVADSVAAMFV